MEYTNLYLGSYGAYVTRGLDGGHGNLAFFEKDLYFVCARDDERVLSVIGHEAKIGLLPYVYDAIEHAFECGLVGG